MRTLFCSLALIGTTEAFAPRAFVGAPPSASLVSSPSTLLRFGVDPTFFSDVSTQQDLVSQFTSMTLSDEAISAAATSAAVDMDPAQLAGAADTAADSGNGWFGFLAVPIEGLLTLIHQVFAAVMGMNAWGVSIIVLTVLVKILTFPLTKSQLESTTRMQKMQPAVKEIQSKYASNPEVMNQKVAEFYQANDVNPLAGCLPSLVQIPVFIGLYRSVLTLAKENKLDEAFLWLPSLEGPTYGADPAHGSDWILKGWVDGVPSLGWEDTTAFLILPVLLVVSQFASMELMSPKSDDPAQQQSNIILKFLPLMIGWFSLNVPSALTVYWLTNNIITTGTSLFVRSQVKTPEPVGVGGSSTTVVEPPTQTEPIFAPIREKPSGFGDAPISEPSDTIKPLTVDAEIVDAEVETEGGFVSDAPKPRSKGKKRKKKKKRKN